MQLNMLEAMNIYVNVVEQGSLDDFKNVYKFRLRRSDCTDFHVT